MTNLSHKAIKKPRRPIVNQNKGKLDLVSKLQESYQNTLKDTQLSFLNTIKDNLISIKQSSSIYSPIYKAKNNSQFGILLSSSAWLICCEGNKLKWDLFYRYLQYFQWVGPIRFVWVAMNVWGSQLFLIFIQTS